MKIYNICILVFSLLCRVISFRFLPKSIFHKSHFIYRSKQRVTTIEMAAGAPDSGGSSKLKTLVDTRVGQKTSTKKSYKEEIETDWRLILHDDTIHTIEQVCDIIVQCVPLCPGPRAYEVTLEVHMSGAATVAVSNKKIIEEYCNSLQAAGLSVSMAPDADFEKDEDLTSAPTASPGTS